MPLFATRYCHARPVPDRRPEVSGDFREFYGVLLTGTKFQREIKYRTRFLANQRLPARRAPCGRDNANEFSAAPSAALIRAGRLEVIASAWRDRAGCPSQPCPWRCRSRRDPHWPDSSDRSSAACRCSSAASQARSPSVGSAATAASTCRWCPCSPACRSHAAAVGTAGLRRRQTNAARQEQSCQSDLRCLHHLMSPLGALPSARVTVRFSRRAFVALAEPTRDATPSSCSTLHASQARGSVQVARCRRGCIAPEVFSRFHGASIPADVLRGEIHGRARRGREPLFLPGVSAHACSARDRARHPRVAPRARPPAAISSPGWSMRSQASGLRRLKAQLRPRFAKELPRGEGAEYQVYPRRPEGALLRAAARASATQLYASIGIPREDRPGALSPVLAATTCSTTRRSGCSSRSTASWARRNGPTSAASSRTSCCSRAPTACTAARRKPGPPGTRPCRPSSKLPPEHILFCGIALGHADEAAPINRWRSEREPVDAFATFRRV